MSKTAFRLVALFMLLWLPLSSGSALAASLAMQFPTESCHESGMLSQHDDQAFNDDPSSACTSCGVCHLACNGSTVVQSSVASLVVTNGQIVTFMPEIFISHISAPLLPPPLARA
ncbi:MAG: DUF2946 family protein [Sideroxydans sp.]|jgi:cytochrome c553